MMSMKKILLFDECRLKQTLRQQMVIMMLIYI